MCHRCSVSDLALCPSPLARGWIGPGVLIGRSEARANGLLPSWRGGSAPVRAGKSEELDRLLRSKRILALGGSNEMQVAIAHVIPAKAGIHKRRDGRMFPLAQE
jgi:hypothetical protein